MTNPEPAPPKLLASVVWCLRRRRWLFGVLVLGAVLLAELAVRRQQGAKQASRGA